MTKKEKPTFNTLQLQRGPTPPPSKVHETCYRVAGRGRQLNGAENNGRFLKTRGRQRRRADVLRHVLKSRCRHQEIQTLLLDSFGTITLFTRAHTLHMPAVPVICFLWSSFGGFRDQEYGSADILFADGFQLNKTELMGFSPRNNNILLGSPDRDIFKRKERNLASKKQCVPSSHVWPVTLPQRTI